MTMLDARLQAGETLSAAFPASFNALAVVAEGRARVGETTAGAGELVLFANDGERMEITAEEPTHLVVLAGEPLNEPIVQYGPFVMNTPDEIRQAIYEVQSGGFGDIPD